MLDAIEQITGLTVFPNLSTSTDECIVYSLEQVSDDGVKKTERFTVRIITKDMVKADIVANQVKQLLLTVGDNTKEEFDILECVQNGGGVLYDKETKMNHSILIFYFTKKSEVLV